MDQERLEQASGISKAIEAAGSQHALAGELGVTQQAISRWLLRGWVPRRRAMEIENQYGVPRATLVDPKLLDAVSSENGL
jgi:DNA-binding transcriptional regulator YdaS (Cro superfamily)